MHTKPWGYINENGEFKGIFVDYSKELEKRSGIEFERSLAPYARVWRNLQNGKTDISFLIRSNDRDDIVEYVTKFITSSSVVVAKKGAKLKSYQDLKTLNIGVVRGVRLSKKFDEDSNLNKKEFRDYEILFHMFKEGRVDAVAGNIVSILYLAKESGIEDNLGDIYKLETIEAWVQISKKSKNKQIIPKIEKAAKSIKDDKFLEKTIDTYIGNRWREVL